MNDAIGRFDRKRRALLAGAAGAALGSAAPAALWTPSASAAATCGSGVVVGTWGGDYQRLLHDNVDPLVAPSGLTPVYDVGSALARQTKMRAEAQARRATLDVALLRDNDMYQMYAEQATAPIDAHAIPNLANLMPAFKRSYSVPHIFSALVLVYDRDKFKTPPDSMNALLDPALKGRIGVVDDQYDYLTMAGALASGGTVKDLELGRKFLLALKQQSPKVFPSTDALATALKGGDAWITVSWKARVVQWRKAGLPVDYAMPKEGALPATFEGGIAAGSRNKACAAAYLNALLEPKAQLGFAQDLGYAPTISNAGLPPELQQSVGFSSAELDKLVQVDFDVLMKNKQALLDFWNKEFRPGL
jgi:putative spermidine/putrescine transport system substrate-binding protein